jgi:signal transduction histidine kinase
MQERVLHALDLGMLGDWEGAKRSLEQFDDPLVSRLLALITDQQRLEKERAETLAVARHELGNALSIAQANVEAMLDGLLEATPDRLAGIRDALQSCGALVVDLNKHTLRNHQAAASVEEFNICEFIAAQTRLVSTIAEAKNVRLTNELCAINDGSCSYRGDAQSIARAIRHVLLSAVRFTPPGGDISIGCVHPSNQLLLSVRSPDMTSRSSGVGLAVLEKMLETIGGHARILAEDPERASFFISLPAVALA